MHALSIRGVYHAYTCAGGQLRSVNAHLQICYDVAYTWHTCMISSCAGLGFRVGFRVGVSVLGFRVRVRIGV